MIPEPGTNCILTATWNAALNLLPNDPRHGSLSFLADDALRAAAGTDNLTGWNAEHSTAEAVTA